jgi:hypothetical protein
MKCNDLVPGVFAMASNLPLEILRPSVPVLLCSKESQGIKTDPTNWSQRVSSLGLRLPLELSAELALRSWNKPQLLNEKQADHELVGTAW